MADSSTLLTVLTDTIRVVGTIAAGALTILLGQWATLTYQERKKKKLMCLSLAYDLAQVKVKCKDICFACDADNSQKLPGLLDGLTEAWSFYKELGRDDLLLALGADSARTLDTLHFRSLETARKLRATWERRTSLFLGMSQVVGRTQPLGEFAKQFESLANEVAEFMGAIGRGRP